MKKKKVLIDVTLTIPNNEYISGIGKSVFWLVDALNKIEPASIPFAIELYAVGIKSIGFNFYNWKFKHHVIPIPSSISIGKINLVCIFRNLFIEHDLLYIPCFTDYYFKNEKTVATYHDLDFYNKSSDFKKKTLYHTTAAHSSGIACCSKFTESEVLSHIPEARSKTKVIYWGCDLNLFREVSKDMLSTVLEKYGIFHRYFFACSCNTPRKNIKNALQAFKLYKINNPQSDYIFVLLWGNPPKSLIEEFQDEINGGLIRFLPFITDEELVTLYNGAALTVYVTRLEGFGFPILESFACGTPVMTCKNSSLVEIGGEAAIYVGEDNINQMAETFSLIEENKFDMERFHVCRKQQLKKFDWLNCARDYIDFFNKNLK